MNHADTADGGMAFLAMNAEQGWDAPGSFRDIVGCELAAEVLRSSGELRLRVNGSSMLPAVWPGDLLLVSSREATEAQPGDIVLFKRKGGLVAHRVVEVRRQKTGVGIQDSGFRIQDSGSPIQDSRFKIPNSASLVSDFRSPMDSIGVRKSDPFPVSLVPSPESRVPAPVSRTEFITRGDSVAGNDAPVSCDELLGRVISIERGSRQVTPHQSIYSRLASMILSRSDFATRVVLKVRKTGLGVRDWGLRIRRSGFEISRDLGYRIQDLT